MNEIVVGDAEARLVEGIQRELVVARSTGHDVIAGATNERVVAGLADSSVTCLSSPMLRTSSSNSSAAVMRGGLCS